MSPQEISAELRSFEQEIVNRLEQSRKEFAPAPQHLPLSYSYSSVKGAAAFSDIGKRQTMEDAEIIVDKYLGEETTVSDECFFVFCFFFVVVFFFEGGGPSLRAQHSLA